MKKLLLSAIALMAIANIYAQYPTSWPLTTTSNGTSAGYVGLGIKPLFNSTTLPGFDFHVHGSSDWIISEGEIGVPGFTSNNLGVTTNYGKTARMGLTNTTTGLLASDGTEIRQSGLNFSIANQEAGAFSLSAKGKMTMTTIGEINFNGAGTRLIMLNSKSYFGNSTSYPGVTNALLNVQALAVDNGLLIKTTGAGKFGLGLRVATDIEKAIIVYGTDASKINFEVRGNGNVFARKYTTTLANPFPDYVFASDYKLLSFTDLRSYVATNNRLPNMPSATQVDAEGADLGELNRLLVEKVEELTLYILQLEERMKRVENGK
jgi:hypothetical protein